MRTAGAVLQHRRRLRRPGPAARASQIGGGRKTRGRDTPAATHEEKWRGQVQFGIPALGGPAPRGPPGGREGESRGWLPRREPLRLLPARQPHPALSASCRGGGILWRRQREESAIGRLPTPRCLQQSARLPLRRERGHSDLEKHTSFPAGCQKPPRFRRSNMVH